MNVYLVFVLAHTPLRSHHTGLFDDRERGNKIRNDECCKNKALFQEVTQKEKLRGLKDTALAT